MSTNPYHLGALICGILTATGLLGIGAIFALYRLEEWLNRNDQPEPEPEQPELDECAVHACRHHGILTARERPNYGGRTLRVCAGHHDEGTVRGWWAS